jgi:hypothetical protein
MKALVVGGDRTDAFAKALEEAAITFSAHWHGRKPKEARRAIPTGVDLIVIVWDRVSHPLSESVRLQAEARGIPLLFCRSGADLKRKLGERSNVMQVAC